MSVKKENRRQVDRKYIVTRNGFKVSETEYSTKDQALDEYDFWQRIITKYPDGSKVDIIEK